jgi:hypothetical protein
MSSLGAQKPVFLCSRVQACPRAVIASTCVGCPAHPGRICADVYGSPQQHCGHLPVGVGPFCLHPGCRHRKCIQPTHLLSKAVTFEVHCALSDVACAAGRQHSALGPLHLAHLHMIPPLQPTSTHLLLDYDVPTFATHELMSLRHPSGLLSSLAEPFSSSPTALALAGV